VSAPLIHGNRRAVPASDILTALGDALGRIRQEDRLTWVDVGRVLGKSDDQAAKYADGTAEMGAVALFYAKQAWGERFTGGVNSLLTEAIPAVDGQAAQSCILKAALALSVALEDGILTDEEIALNRSTLERAGDAIASQLARLGPKDRAA
jgi:hypothetical protein